MIKQSVAIIFVALTICGCSTSPSTDYCRWVDPFIGTGGHGHTYPGAALPFGMVQLSPDTRLTGWDSCSGYHYSDNIIYGFSHTHLSGTGVADYCDILLKPTVGEAEPEQKDYCSKFKHENETASPGYYSVVLDDYNIKAELTVTPGVGVHRYTFPAAEKANIIIDLTHRDKLIDYDLTFVNNREIEGFRRSSAWAKDQHLYFVARFSKPFNVKDGNHKGPRRGQPIRGAAKDTKKHEGRQKLAVVTFRTKANEQIVVKVGISAVSIEGARKNLETEAANKCFQRIRTEAQGRWNRALSKIKIKGGTNTQKRVFYTALYHSLLNPNLFMDVDGQYRGRDLNIHRSDDFTYYTVFSLWDTYRAEHPLFTIIEPERTNDFIKTFITQYEQGGLLPVWELAANETFCMIGYHSVPVIVDAYFKGLRDYDVEKAYEAIKHSAEQDHLGLKFYKRYGFIPGDEEGDSVSKTLEYAYDDWCIAQMAKALGKETDYRWYMERAQFYKNIFDPSTGFMRAKMKGIWFTPFDPAEVNFNYTEANAWQYSFYVPQDIRGLIRLMGGKEKFIAKLDALFSADSCTTGTQQADITGLIGQYAHGNEPSHHMAYLYNYANQPWKTQQRVRQILDTLYSDTPEGLCGNEDCGQMSAWYVLSAMGFYPVTPGQDIYAIGTPVFPEVAVDVGEGNTFRVIADNVSEKNIYIQSATLNGLPYTKSWLRHGDIMKGGTLVFEMGPVANKKWGSSDADIPYSGITDHLIVPVPFVAKGSRTFVDSLEIALASVIDGAEIYFTLDGTTPTPQSGKYTGPFILTTSTTVKAIAVKQGRQSMVMEARFTKIPRGRGIRLNSRYAPQYSAGGDMALIDGIRGGGDFKTGTWQGYEGIDIDAIVDLGKNETINQISIGFLQDNNSWIFMPLKVDYFISSDGKTFKKAGVVLNDIPHEQAGSITKDFAVKVPGVRARYIKVHAYNIGVCPGWHKGAGGKAWIFADEIIVRF